MCVLIWKDFQYVVWKRVSCRQQGADDGVLTQVTESANVPGNADLCSYVGVPYGV